MRVSPFAKEYIRKRAEMLMNGTCRIWTPSEDRVRQPDGSYKAAPGLTKYEGPCRLWEVSAGSLQSVNDQMVAETNTYFSIPWDAPVPESQDWIKIITHEDPALVGRTVYIHSMYKGGGLRASRRFMVEIKDAVQRGNW